MGLVNNMSNIYLLKEYDGHSAGEIVSVSTNVAFGLINSGIARKTSNRDFLVKPEFGETKAFQSSPSRVLPKKKQK